MEVWRHSIEEIVWVASPVKLVFWWNGMLTSQWVTHFAVSGEIGKGLRVVRRHKIDENLISSGEELYSNRRQRLKLGQTMRCLGVTKGSVFPAHLLFLPFIPIFLQCGYRKVLAELSLPWWLSSRESASNAGDAGLISGLGRPPGGGVATHSYSCLENPMNRGAWQATVHRVAKSQTWLKRLSRHSLTGWTKIPTPFTWCLANRAPPQWDLQTSDGAAGEVAPELGEYVVSAAAI